MTRPQVLIALVKDFWLLFNLIRADAALENDLTDVIESFNMLEGGPGIRRYRTHPVVGLTYNVEFQGAGNSIGFQSKGFRGGIAQLF